MYAFLVRITYYFWCYLLRLNYKVLILCDMTNDPIIGVADKKKISQIDNSQYDNTPRTTDKDKGPERLLFFTSGQIWLKRLTDLKQIWH